MVGDSLRDLQAGAAGGCQPHLVRTGKGRARSTTTQLEQMLAQVPGAQVHADLAAFAEHLIQRRAPGARRSGKRDSGFGRLRLMRALVDAAALGAVRAVHGVTVMPWATRGADAVDLRARQRGVLACVGWLRWRSGARA